MPSKAKVSKNNLHFEVVLILCIIYIFFSYSIFTYKYYICMYCIVSDISFETVWIYGERIGDALMSHNIVLKFWEVK